MFGQAAEPGIHAKAAALLHDVAKSQSLFDGKKRLALTTTLNLYAKNGCWNTTDIGAVYDLMLSVASDQLDSIDRIAEWLSSWFTR